MAPYAAALARMRTGRDGGWRRERFVNVTDVVPDVGGPDGRSGGYSCHDALTCFLRRREQVRNGQSRVCVFVCYAGCVRHTVIKSTKSISGHRHGD